MSGPAIQVTVAETLTGWRWVARTAGGEIVDGCERPFATSEQAVADARDHAPPEAMITVAEP